MSGDADHMRSGPVPMGFLVSPDRHFRHMSGHDPVREDKFDIAGTTAAVCIFMQFDAGHIGNKIRFPQMIAWPDRNKIAFAGPVIFFADAILETERIVENKRIVVECVHQQGHVGCRNNQSPFTSARIEVAVRHVDRYRKHAFGRPFEASLAAVRQLDLCGAVAVKDVINILVKMAKRGA